ncbi:spore germination protein [Cohnella faecalis]|uniref:spore germination protein n=1 Tax=Cohnella faecalis TaxID=2315694 RepID=UPI001F3728DE|nr:spore germination protein [Cohnella faecalis]
MFNYFENHGASAETAHIIGDLDTAVRDILGGNVVVLFDKWDKALSFKALSIQERQVTETLTEPVVRGPHESTVENLMKNIGLLRIRLKTPDFKLNLLTAGGKTHSEMAYGYIEGAANPETLAEFEKRIERTKEMEILETSYIEELLEDSLYSPFPQVRITERPDTAVAALLDGKIIVMVSGSPSILICPGLFTEFLQSPEDYYQRTGFSSMIRLLRFISFFLTIVLPAIYIALTTFHPELIPTVLLLAILNTREGIPFPALLEALIMIFFLEILTEAGVRLPRPVGSAVSIVGALVIGEAAINAGIASPIMVVVVSLTAIASFSLPQYNLSMTVRILRIPLMLLASILGGFGLMIGFLWITLHLMSLRSLGQPYLAPIGPARFRQLRDVFVRMPLEILHRYPRNKQRHHSTSSTKKEG